MTRLPPQNIEAEESVLGSVMIDPEMYTEVERLVEADDFYREANREVYRAIGSLINKGEPIDLVMMTEQLRQQGSLSRIGGVNYLVGLMDRTPVAAYAGSYADKVREKARLRDLINVCGTLMNDAYTGREEFTGILSKADTELTRLIAHVHKGTSDSEAVDAALAYLDGTAKVKTGFSSLDELTGGLPIGDLTTLGARSTTGKALAVDTPILTTKGWSTMGELQVGQQVFDQSGKPCTILRATEVMNDRPCFKVRFADGSEIIADAEHQWATRKRESSGIRTTQQIRNDMLADEGKKRPYRHAIPVSGPLSLPEVQLPLHPYVLGVWLGDGTSAQATVTNPDTEIRERIEVLGYPTKDRGQGASTCPCYGLTNGDRSQISRDNSVQKILREMGLLNNKHIPFDYLMANTEQRTELLKGLMDTDGYCDTHGQCEYTTIDARFAQQVCELIRGLGYKANVTEGDATINGRFICTKYRINFTPRMASNVFHLSRKAARIHNSKRFDKSQWRAIVEIEPIESVPVRCIEVDSPSHLFLAGKTLIPTHNSALSYQIAVEIISASNIKVGILSPDQEKGAIVSTLAARLAQVPLPWLESGRANPTQRQTYGAAVVYVNQHILPNLIINDAVPHYLSVESEVNRLVRQGCGVIFVDTLQAINEGKEIKRTQIDHTCRTLKGLARQYRIPIVAISQIKQTADYQQDKRPRDYDLSESKNIYDLSQTVLLLYRDSLSNGYDSSGIPAALRTEPVEIRAAKQKTGRKNGVARLQFLPDLQIFKNQQGIVPGISIKSQPFNPAAFTQGGRA